jgi:WD40 repeat protein
MKPSKLSLAAFLFAAGLLAYALGGAGADAQQPPPPGPPDAHGDPLPAAALKRFGTVRFRHGDKILCLAYSPDGKILAAGGGTDPVRLWDAQTGKEIRQLKDVWALALAFSPDGTLLASGGGYKTIRIWDVATGRERFVLKGHTASIKSLAFSPDGNELVSGSQDRTVRRWDVRNGNQIAVYKGHQDEVNAVAFSRDGKVIASGGGDRSIRLWNGQPAALLDAGCAVQALAFAPDGKTLASAGDDNLIRLWDTDNRREIRKLTGHKDTVLSLAFADARTLFSGAYDKTIRRWDVDRGETTLTIKRRAGDSEALALSPRGDTVATAGTDNTIRRFDAGTGKEAVAVAGPQAGASAVAYSPDGKLVASASVDGEIRLWDAATGKDVRRWMGPAGEVHLAFSEDGNTLATGAGTDGVRLWGVADGKELQHLPAPEGDTVTCLAFGPGGKSLAVGYRQSGVRLWDGKQSQTLRYPGGVQAVAVSPDGKLVAGAGSGKVVLWDARSSQELRQLGRAAPVAALAFSPDSRKLAAGMYDSTIQLYTLKDKDPVEPRVLEGHQSAVYAIAFSANGRVLASGSYDKTVRLWETVNGLQVASWPGHLGAATAVAVHPRGRRVLSGSADTTLQTWDVTGLRGELPEVELQAAEMAALWNDLASNDNPKGNRALWRMVCGGKHSAPYLSKKVFLSDPRKIEQYIKDLNDNKFAVRQRASEALGSYGRWIEGVLREAIKSPPSDEVRRRLQVLLKALDSKEDGRPSITLEQERLRARRVMEILEQTATPPARELLASIAREGAEPDLRDAAAAALRRLSLRNGGR